MCIRNVFGNLAPAAGGGLVTLLHMRREARKGPVGRDSEMPASLCGLSLWPPWAGPLLPSSVTHAGSLNATCQLIRSCSQGGAQRGLRSPPHPRLRELCRGGSSINYKTLVGPQGNPTLLT